MSYDGFPPFISAHLQYLLNHYPHTIQIEQARSGTRYFPGSLDRFTLLIPYCLDYMKWDVIYNAEFPLAAPDVIFGAEDEDFHPFHVPCGEDGDSRLVKNSLTDWNNKDPTRLLALVTELRDKYRSYQEKRVGEVDDDRLKFEISTIVSREKRLLYRYFVVTAFLCTIGISFLHVTETPVIVLQGIEMHMSSGVEKVIYPVGRKYASVPSAPRLKLMCTPELKALFSIDDVKLPSWLDGMCMAEYLPHLEELLQRQVLEAVTLIDVRRQFIEALAPLLGRPLEADPVFCRKASYLVCSGPFTFMV
ncbi:hypothetical protein POTOM_020100 [Populus tomentosa]|uniref:BRISC and BRCA1-A complex member 2 n=1 Tax=Populus tomentosa TaxID=118781 RepID=A0A8X7ZYI7_POPTO|nr:hypothetical protein POTOM_020100 [Populus tomentosa]